MLTLHTLSPSRRGKDKRRRGRGAGSGRGTYSGRGVKGQRARSGGTKGLKRFGMKKMIQSLPKRRGFLSQYAKSQTVSLDALEHAFQEGDKVTPSALHKRGMAPQGARVKILAQGVVRKKLRIAGCLCSKQAKASIIKAGGTVL